jgi:acyl-coenzyme A thioesterase 1/2/4
MGCRNQTGTSPNQEDKRVRRYIRARGAISEQGGHQAHLSALAYITDSYFIGTISLVHDIPRFSSPAELEKLLNALKNPSDLDDEDITRALKELKEEEAAELRRRVEGALNRVTMGQKEVNHKEVGMMVSLDHSIYFHNPWAFRADEWMLTEMESPWAGEGRGLAIQKIWSKDGLLIATCMQEVCVCLSIMKLSANLIIGCGAVKARQAATVEDLKSLCYTPNLKELSPVSVNIFPSFHISSFIDFGLVPPLTS